MLAQLTLGYSTTVVVNDSPWPLVISICVSLLTIASFWAIFEKAGQPGWAAIVPIYNAWVLCEVAGKSGWWLLLLLIPGVNAIALFFIMLGLARAFGRGVPFSLGLYFLSVCFLPILAFGDSRYEG